MPTFKCNKCDWAPEKQQTTNTQTWMDNNRRLVVEALNDKQQAYKVALGSNNPENLTEYRKIRKDSTKLFKSTKAEFMNSKLNQYSSNPKNFWREVNFIMGIDSTPTCNIKLKNNDNSFISDLEIPDYMITVNNVAEELGKKFLLRGINPKPFLISDIKSTMTFVDVQPNYVLKLINEINTDKPYSCKFKCYIES